MPLTRLVRLTDPWFVTLMGVSTLLQALVAVSRPMASYRALEIGMAPESLGLVAAAFALAPLAFAISIGRLIDRYGETRFLLASTVALGGASLALAAIGSAPLLLVSLAVLGLAQLISIVAIQTLVGTRSHASGYDRRYGHLAFVASLGQLIGPAVGGLIAGEGSAAGTTRALVFGALLALAALPLIALARRRDPGHAVAPSPGDQPSPPVLAILRMPGMGPAMLASLTVLSAIDVLVVYLPALGEERGIAAATVGALLAVRAATSMASRFLLGRMIDVLGRERLMLVSLVASAGSIVVMPFLPLAAMFAVMAVAGFALGIGQPMTMSWVAARATPGARATAMSLRIMGNRLGQVVIPLAAGALAAVSGTAGVLAATGLAVAATAVVVGARPMTGPPTTGPRPTAGAQPGVIVEP